MRILNLCSEDHANYMYNNMLALRSVGIECDSYKLHKHPFNYANEAVIESESHFESILDKYDIIQLFHTYLPTFSLLGRTVFVYHTGTVYRQGMKHYNNVFNKIVQRTFVDIPDLFNRDAINCTLFTGAIKQGGLQYTHNIPLKIGHFPSNPDNKGTANIIKAMEQYKTHRFEFICSTQKVSNEENLKRMDACDIIIDLMQPKQWGKNYGAWGVTSLEAAAMGKVVWSSNTFNDIYKQHYGHCPIASIYEPKDLKRFIDYYTTIPLLTFRRHQEIMYNWINEKHSFNASGEYFKKFIYGI